MRGTDIEFVHQSSRDYLVGENGKCILDTSELYGHHEIVVSCLSYLSQKLKVNLVDLPRPDSTWSSMEQNELLRSLDYSATFWAQHLEGARWEIPMQSAPIEQRVIHTFLCSKFLEWLECLSLLDKLERAADALKILQNIADLEDNVSLSMLVQGAKYFLFQDYETIEVLPLEIYNSRTLIGHSGWIITIAFSPDGKKIASGSSDQSIKLWDIAEALKVSRIFGNRVGRHIDFRKWQEIETLKVSRIFGNRVVHHIDFRKLQEIETSEEVKF
ncbi:hypothetical protein H4I95_01804 [Botrytis cinerea]